MNAKQKKNLAYGSMIRSVLCIQAQAGYVGNVMGKVSVQKDTDEEFSRVLTNLANIKSLTEQIEKDLRTCGDLNPKTCEEQYKEESKLAMKKFLTNN